MYKVPQGGILSNPSKCGEGIQKKGKRKKGGMEVKGEKGRITKKKYRK